MDNLNEYPISIYNSLKRSKEIFQPINERKVGMYACGPTVYGDPHLGNCRGAITFDIVFRYFTFLGYKVRYVRNITDVGHLEDEVADAGEDKISKKARLEQLEPMEVAHTYTLSFHEAMRQLNTLPPSIEPTATGHIIEQIELIQQLFENGYAYEVDGSVYFDIKKYSDKGYPYGDLSGRVVEDLLEGTRSLDGQSEKRNAADFALWKKAKPEHIMKWNSPWGLGFPGWHLECTAMSSKYLGFPFDIHGGGMDLQFPHHEAEIAQSFGACGCAPANYWMHNNMLTVDSQKMAKSKGNFITLAEMFSGEHKLLDRAFSPMTIRFFMLQSHYRSTIDFSNEALVAAEKGYKKLMTALSLTDKISYEGTVQIDDELVKEINELCDACYKHMSDDFNTAQTLAALFELSAKVYAFYNKQIKVGSIDEITFNRLIETFNLFIKDVLGLEVESEGQSSKLDDVMEMMIDMRKDARLNKDWALSDKIRDDLAAKGIILKDEKEGRTSYSVE